MGSRGFESDQRHELGGTLSLLIEGAVEGQLEMLHYIFLLKFLHKLKGEWEVGGSSLVRAIFAD